MRGPAGRRDNRLGTAGFGLCREIIEPVWRAVSRDNARLVRNAKSIENELRSPQGLPVGLASHDERDERLEALHASCVPGRRRPKAEKRPIIRPMRGKGSLEAAVADPLT